MALRTRAPASRACPPQCPTLVPRVPSPPSSNGAPGHLPEHQGKVMAIDPGQGTAQLPEGLGADRLHHGEAGSAVAASPAGAKARRVCTPWAGTQPCRRGQPSVPQQQGHLPLHPRPSPVLGTRGWRKPAVSTAPLIAPLGNSCRTLKVRRLQRAAPCPPSALCLERACGGTAPKCNQEPSCHSKDASKQD